MKNRSVDVAILGAGTAGLTARRAAKSHGASALMIDPGPLGTTCARVGCMPSKLLIAAADAAYHASHADVFGVNVGDISIDQERVLGRIRSERDRFVGFVLKAFDSAREDDEFLQEYAEIVEPGVLRAGDHMITYKSLVLATGSTPFIPPPFRGLEDTLLTNEEIFEIEKLPESLLVIGLGVIGLELGQAMHRLGVQTTFLGQGGSVGPIADPEILAVAQRDLSLELDLHPTYELESISSVSGGVKISFVDSAGKKRTETFEKILMAAGRRPNMSMGLENIGIEPADRGKYDIDPLTLQIGEHPVFVAGDANNLHPLLHEAADDGRIAGENAANFPNVRAARRRTGLGIVFTDPQIAIVGGGYSSLQSCAATAGEVDFSDQGRSRVQNINKGKARIYGNIATGELIGAEIFGPRAEHVAHLLAWAVQQHLTVEQALDMPFYHPVIEEGIRTALRDLSTNLRRGTSIKCCVADVPIGS